MKITNTIIQIGETTETVQINCDFCGKTSLRLYKNTPIFNGITNFTISPGFGSKFDSLSPSTDFNFDICDECLENLILKQLK